MPSAETMSPSGPSATFQMPVKPQQTKRTTSTKPTPQSRTASKPARRRILVVDDDSVVRESLKTVLECEGYNVITAGDGQQALDQLSKEEVDLALLDLNMPVMNGWDTFERLTAKHPLLPVIIVTARPNQIFTALGAGAGALLEKPLDIPALLRCIETLLAEPLRQRLERLAGTATDFHYTGGVRKTST